MLSVFTMITLKKFTFSNFLVFHEKYFSKKKLNKIYDRKFVTTVVGNCILKNDYHHIQKYQGKVKAVIFDWAGTTVDCGCFAPVVTFKELFKNEGVNITVEEARRPMGLHKKDHIEKLIYDENISSRWINIKGAAPTNRDVDRLYDAFIPQQLKSMQNYSSVIQGVVETTAYLKKEFNLKIGSCSGYPKVVLNELVRSSALEGFSPDVNVAADEVVASRPCPFMIWVNAVKLGIYPMESIIKVDDTVEGIREGIAAGCWTVGIAKTGNYVGATAEELKLMTVEDLNNRLQRAYKILMDSGAHYVIDSVNDLPSVVANINQRLTLK